MSAESVNLTRPVDRRTLGAFLLDELAGFSPGRGEAALGHARRFAALLGDPQDAVPHVHVVGTAGKGAVAGAVTRLAVGSSVPVVTHMSPHVYDLRERFLVDGDLADWDRVLSAAREVHAAAAVLGEETGRPPSFFAATAALAWVLGRRQGAKLMVTEAGIGGRYDATNVIGRADKVTVVTTVGLDHQDVLGDDPDAIAREKAGVITPGGVVVVGPQRHPEALDAVVEIAAGREARVVMADQSIRDWWRAALETARLVGVELGIDSGPETSVDPLPGRVEFLESDDHVVVLDGAHNPLKLEALLAALASDPRTATRDLIALVAIGRGKDLEGCADVLASGVGRAVVTEFGDPADPAAHPRSRTAPEVARALASRGVDILGERVDPDAAAELAIASVGPQAALVVTGSFFHLAAARDRLVELTGG